TYIVSPDLSLYHNSSQPTPLYSRSLHDALPIFNAQMAAVELSVDKNWLRHKLSFFYASGDDNPTDSHATGFDTVLDRNRSRVNRSEEHTSELQSLRHLVCRLLLEQKKYNR